MLYPLDIIVFYVSVVDETTVYPGVLDVKFVAIVVVVIGILVAPAKPEGLVVPVMFVCVGI